jgi:hypothetical protein
MKYTIERLKYIGLVKVTLPFSEISYCGYAYIFIKVVREEKNSI